MGSRWPRLYFRAVLASIPTFKAARESGFPSPRSWRSLIIWVFVAMSVPSLIRRKPNTVELAVTYCRGEDCEFVSPLRRGGRGGDFPAETRGIASPRNPPVSPLRKGGIIGNPVPDVSYG